MVSENRRIVVGFFILVAAVLIGAIILINKVDTKNTLIFQVPVNDDIIKYSVTLVETKKGNHDVVFSIDASEYNNTMSNNSIKHILPGLGTIKFDTRKSTGIFHVASWLNYDELKKIIKSSSLIINDSKDSIKLENITLKEVYIDPHTIRNYTFGDTTPQ